MNRTSISLARPLLSPLPASKPRLRLRVGAGPDRAEIAEISRRMSEGAQAALSTFFDTAPLELVNASLSAYAACTTPVRPLLIHALAAVHETQWEPLLDFARSRLVDPALTDPDRAFLLRRYAVDAYGGYSGFSVDELARLCVAPAWRRNPRARQGFERYLHSADKGDARARSITREPEIEGLPLERRYAYVLLRRNGYDAVRAAKASGDPVG